jgi:hypothetical protein
VVVPCLRHARRRDEGDGEQEDDCRRRRRHCYSIEV